MTVSNESKGLGSKSTKKHIPFVKRLQECIHCFRMCSSKNPQALGCDFTRRIGALLERLSKDDDGGRRNTVQFAKCGKDEYVFCVKHNGFWRDLLWFPCEASEQC